MDGQLVIDCATGEAAEIEAAPVGTVVPETVTPRQARLVLLNAGLLEQVEASFDEMSHAAWIEWNYALEVRRDSPLIAALAPALGLTAEQIDALFIEAAGM
jgi:hypothetical protein